MSTKAMGRMYTGNGGPSLGGGSPDSPSLLSSLFGQDGITGGEGESQYQGSGGIFGGQSRRMATMLNAQKNNLLLQMQGDKDFAKLQNQLDEHKLQTETAQKKLIADSEYAHKLADKYGVPIEGLQELGPLLTSNAAKEQKMTGASLDRPEAQVALNSGVDHRLSGVNPNLLPTAAQGAVTAFPTPYGQMGSLAGALPNQDTYTDAFGMSHAKTSNTPGGMTLPIPPGAKDAASQLPPPSPTPTPSGVNPSPFGAVDPRFGGGNMLGAGIAPIPANSQGMNGSMTRTGVSAMPTTMQGAGGISPITAGMGAANPANGPVSANPGMLPSPAMGQSNQAAIEAQRKAQIMQMIMQQIQQQGAIRPQEDMEGAGQTNPEDYAPYDLNGRPHYAQ